eukprot:242577-Rhodomonas_salina.1
MVGTCSGCVSSCTVIPCGFAVSGTERAYQDEFARALKAVEAKMTRYRATRCPAILQHPMNLIRDARYCHRLYCNILCVRYAPPGTDTDGGAGREQQQWFVRDAEKNEAGEVASYEPATPCPVLLLPHVQY